MIVNVEEKSIFEIAQDGIIIFSSDVLDTFITINSSTLKWWMFCGDEKYYLADELCVHNDFNVMTMAAAKKLASDWFDLELRKSAYVCDMDDYDCNGNSTSNYVVVKNTTIKSSAITTTAAAYSSSPPKIEPKFFDESKRDIHTEHCCLTHLNCKYNDDNCTVCIGKKKPSYPCNCSLGY